LGDKGGKYDEDRSEGEAGLFGKEVEYVESFRGEDGEGVPGPAFIFTSKLSPRGGGSSTILVLNIGSNETTAGFLTSSGSRCRSA